MERLALNVILRTVFGAEGPALEQLRCRLCRAQRALGTAAISQCNRNRLSASDSQP